MKRQRPGLCSCGTGSGIPMRGCGALRPVSYTHLILKVQSCDLFLYLGGDSDQWVETILEAAEPTGRTLALIDCVETLEEEHVEGMQEEVGDTVKGVVAMKPDTALRIFHDTGSR